MAGIPRFIATQILQARAETLECRLFWDKLGRRHLPTLISLNGELGDEFATSNFGSVYVIMV